MGGLDAIRITTSRGQGQDREGLSEGSPSAKLRAEEHEPHRRLSLRASWHHTTKPESSADRVNAAVVQRKRMFLFGEICSARAPRRRCATNQKGLLVEQGPGAGGGCQPFASERGSDAHRGLGARLRVIGGVTGQGSAEAVVAARERRRAEHESTGRSRERFEIGEEPVRGEPCLGIAGRNRPCTMI